MYRFLPRPGRLIALAIGLATFAAVSGFVPGPTVSARAVAQSLAPELEGGVGWINTDKPIRLKDLRGKVVLLDFWTLC